MPSIVRIDQGPLAAHPDPIAAEKVVAGHPATGFRAAHDDEAAGFYSGVWGSLPGAWRVAYEENELCVILEGRVRLIEDGGLPVEFGPGDAFVIPRGFIGVWETLEPLRKIYAIAG